jgi:hypothetical protein
MSKEKSSEQSKPAAKDKSAEPSKPVQKEATAEQPKPTPRDRLSEQSKAVLKTMVTAKINPATKAAQSEEGNLVIRLSPAELDKAITDRQALNEDLDWLVRGGLLRIESKGRHRMYRYTRAAQDFVKGL